MKRLTSVDFLRGIAILFMTIFHALFTSWNRFQSPDITTMPIGLVILAAFMTILGHWRGFFLMISAIANVYQLMMAFQKGQKRITIFGKQIFAGLVTMVVGKIWMTCFPYWGFIERWTRGEELTLAASWTSSWDMFFLSEAIETVGIMMIVTGFFFLLFTSKLFRNRWQINVVICLIIGIAIIWFSPAIQVAISAIAGIDLTAGENFRTFGFILQEYPPIVEKLVRIPLNWLVGREAPLFPMAAYSFFGIGIALIVTNGAPKKWQLRLLYIPSLIALVYGVYEFIFIAGMPLDLNFHVHPRWFAFMSMGLQIPVVVAFFIWVEFSPKLNQELWLKMTRYVRRFGIFTLTVYFFGIFDAIPRYIYSLFSIPGMDFIHRYGVNDLWAVILTITVLTLWSITLFVWDRVLKGYGSVEFLVGLIRPKKSGQKRNWKDPINLQGTLWDVEMVTYW